jgi:hypothetical protein
MPFTATAGYLKEPTARQRRRARQAGNRPATVLAGTPATKATPVQIDLHGYRPSEIVWNGRLIEIVRQCWEMGETELELIHGHGRARGKTPGFYNTKTGVFGLAIRRILRNKRKLRRWIKYTTLDCRQWGATKVKLKPNPVPSRTSLDPGLIEDRSRLPE